MTELVPVGAEHAGAVLAFELANRDYFTAFISDRGDAFFAEFDQRYQGLLLDQAAGRTAAYLVLDRDGEALGRVNVYGIGDGDDQGCGELGYRVAERAAGRGLATAMVRELCRIAPSQLGLRELTAATTATNLASQQVLARCGFLPVGPADPATIGGATGTLYRRMLDGPTTA